MTITYYGDGKGKTTAALGLALRAIGDGKNVKIIQFIKGDWCSSEEESIKKIKGIEIEKFGLGFVGAPCDHHKHSDHEYCAKLGLNAAQKAINSPKYDVVVLDEINWAIQEYLIKEGKVVDLIKNCPKEKTLVLTGAPKIKELIELSDLVTQMKKIKHPYDKGINAIRGIDF